MLLHEGVLDTPCQQAAKPGLIAELRMRADRSKCLLVPIFQASHFTLLVLEREGAVDGEETPSKPAEQPERKAKH